MEEEKNNTAVMGIIAVIIIGAIVGGIILLQPKDKSISTNSTTTSQSENISSTPASSSARYKDGSYSSEGSYSSPGGNEEIAVTITITNGKVTNSSVKPRAATNESKEYQADFVDGYKVLVTGKDLATLQLGRVSGSSLTSRGFNEALDAIRSQAQI